MPKKLQKTVTNNSKNYLLILAGVFLGSVLIFTIHITSILHDKETKLESKKTSKVPAQLLLLQQAEQGALTPIADTPDEYSLVLTKLSPRVVLFTDRPHRSASSIDQENYINYFWNNSSVNSFSVDPPNAVLTSYDLASDTVNTIVLEIKNPMYKSRTITYSAKAINGTQSFPKELVTPVLYIDIASANIVMTGGGPGKGSTPFQFTLEPIE